MLPAGEDAPNFAGLRVACRLGEGYALAVGVVAEEAAIMRTMADLVDRGQRLDTPTLRADLDGVDTLIDALLATFRQRLAEFEHALVDACGDADTER